MIASPTEAVTAQAGPAPIGGFFERHAPDKVAPGESLLAAWTQGGPYAAFVNARSAFAALAASRPDADIWLPAFLCGDLVQPAYAERLRFYGVQDGFEPDLAPVIEGAAPGDLVLVAAYFGLPFSPAVRAALATRPDLCVVEDRAQALDAGPGLGGWRLHSPRKLLGVADGGLLVAPDATAAPPQPGAAPDDKALWAAPQMRADDPAGRNNSLWHAANQAKEAAMTVSAQAMTAESLAILSATSPASLAGPRLKNWRRLDQRLSAWSALRREPGAPPLGYVLRLAPDARDALLTRLHAARIFAAVHWPRIAGPAQDFPREAAWTRELITLPCDHRYGDAEMDRIAQAVAETLR